MSSIKSTQSIIIYDTSMTVHAQKDRVSNALFPAWLGYSGSNRRDKGTRLCLGFYVGDDVVPDVTEGLSILYAMAPSPVLSLVLTERSSSMLCTECTGRVHLCWRGPSKTVGWSCVDVFGADRGCFQRGRWLVSSWRTRRWWSFVRKGAAGWFGLRWCLGWLQSTCVEVIIYRVMLMNGIAVDID